MASLPTNKTIEYNSEKMSTDAVYIDDSNADAYVEKVGTDLIKISKKFDSIASFYKKLYNNQYTKGEYKTTLRKAVTKTTNQADYCLKRKKEMDAAMDSAKTERTIATLRSDLDALTLAVNELKEKS